MASREALTQSFVDLLRRFSRDLSTTYAEVDGDLKQIHSSIVLFTSTCPEKCRDMFHEHVVVPYGSEIDNQNESFFMSDNFVNDVSKRESKFLDAVSRLTVPSGNVADLVLRLRSIWKNVSEADKENIWKYLSALTHLSRRITGP